MKTAIQQRWFYKQKWVRNSVSSLLRSHLRTPSWQSFVSFLTACSCCFAPQAVLVIDSFYLHNRFRKPLIREIGVRIEKKRALQSEKERQVRFGATRIIISFGARLSVVRDARLSTAWLSNGLDSGISLVLPWCSSLLIDAFERR